LLITELAHDVVPARIDIGEGARARASTHRP
jgi:hypothetical protein